MFVHKLRLYVFEHVLLIDDHAYILTTLSHDCDINILVIMYFVHTALQFRPILGLVVQTFSPPVLCVRSNQAHPRRVSMPSL